MLMRSWWWVPLLQSKRSEQIHQIMDTNLDNYSADKQGERAWLKSFLPGRSWMMRSCFRMDSVDVDSSLFSSGRHCNEHKIAAHRLFEHTINHLMQSTPTCCLLMMMIKLYYCIVLLQRKAWKACQQNPHKNQAQECALAARKAWMEL